MGNAPSNLLTRIQAVYSSTAYFVPVVQRREQGFQGFLRQNPRFITLHQHSSQLLKLPFVSSLLWKLRHLTSSGVCPFSCSRVTQRVTQNSALIFSGADCVALFARCLCG